MQSNSLQAKQQYLREKIIDAGHDAEKFVEFCSEKHNLDDLENWSLHELIDIVQAFLSFNSQGSGKHHLDNRQVLLKETVATSEPLRPGPIAGGAESKMGLVFSDDDWSILLAGPSILAPSKTEKQEAADLPPLFTLEFNSTVSKAQQTQPVFSSKDSPLSPPSIQNKQKNPPPSQVDPLKNEVNLQPLNEQIRMQKKLERKHGAEPNVPINLSNIIITTGKEKTLSPLPNITEVSVPKTEQVSRNFLQGDYTLYHISFLPCQVVIHRKFADLLKLRGILQRLYPFLRLPYLEPEGWLSSSEGKDPETLQKYKWMVEQFIRYIIIRSDQLKNCELVRFFCGFTKRELTKEEFRKKLQAYDNVPRPKFLGEVVLSSNSIAIPPTASAEKFSMSTQTLVNEIDVQYDRLRRQLEALFANYDLLLKSYTDIGTTFETIENLMRRYNQENGIEKDFGSFDGLREMTQRLTRKTLGECEMFKSRVKNLFRYEKENMTTLRQIIDSSSNIHYEFARQGFPPLPASKLKGPNMEIESPIPIEDPVRSNKPLLAIQQVFWSHMLRKQTERYWQLLRKKINEGLTLIAYDELDSQNQNLNFWNSMIKRCVL